MAHGAIFDSADSDNAVVVEPTDALAEGVATRVLSIRGSGSDIAGDVAVSDSVGVADVEAHGGDTGGVQGAAGGDAHIQVDNSIGVYSEHIVVDIFADGGFCYGDSIDSTDDVYPYG